MSIQQAERVATVAEVRSQAAAIRTVLADADLSHPRLAGDGSLVVHSESPRLMQLGTVTSQINAIVGQHVRVFFDDNPTSSSWMTTPL